MGPQDDGSKPVCQSESEYETVWSQASWVELERITIYGHVKECGDVK